MQPQQQTSLQPVRSIKQAAEDARRRMATELASLAAVERELDRLDRQLSELRAQLAPGRRHAP